EKAHDFLWRIRAQLPAAGILGVFDRSHYEDVIVHRVRHLSTPDAIEARYDEIVAFENELIADGTTVIKVMLHISRDEQKARLEARLDDPTKHWKFNPGDIDDRLLWDDFMEAYQVAIRRTSTDAAPWYVAYFFYAL
ncbi:MAG: polyphosphate kinase 2 family protein, partial [Ferruginibacter sp.]|nr:polyphosphate kinase 2 family protein [Ferruginibacter sp.]